LLVVIAIIAILAALLLPALAKAKDSAKTAQCQSNQKQLLIAALAYTGESGGLFAPTFTLQGDETHCANWQVYLQADGVTQPVLLCPVRPVKNGKVLNDEGGYWSMAPDGEVIWNDDPNGNHTTNGLYGDYEANFPLGGCWWPGSWTVPGIKLASVRAPAMVVYTTDGGMAANNTTNANLCIVPTCEVKPGAWVLDDPVSDFDSPDNGVSDSVSDPNWGGPFPRHGTFQSNNGFVDGHVELMRPSQWFYGKTPWLKPMPGY
jgi:prepilin-type processing-associated H-X9-DG protein